MAFHIFPPTPDLCSTVCQWMESPYGSTCRFSGPEALPALDCQHKTTGKPVRVWAMNTFHIPTTTSNNLYSCKMTPPQGTGLQLSEISTKMVPVDSPHILWLLVDVVKSQENFLKMKKKKPTFIGLFHWKRSIRKKMAGGEGEGME